MSSPRDRGRGQPARARRVRRRCGRRGTTACCASSTPSTSCRSTSALPLPRRHRVDAAEPLHGRPRARRRHHRPAPLASYAWRSFLDAGVRAGLRVRRARRGPQPLLRAARCGHPPAGGRPSARRLAAGGADHARRGRARAHRGGARGGGAPRRRSLSAGQLADLVCVDRDLWELESVDPMSIPGHAGPPDRVGGELAYEQD